MMSITDLASEPIPGMLPPAPKETIPGSSLQPKTTLASDAKDSHLTAEEQLAEIVLVKKSLMESWRKS